MPRGMTNPENMPKGLCLCGRPTVATWADDRRRSYAYVCDGCKLASRDCKCEHTIPVYCEKCGEKIGDQEPNHGILYVPSLKEGHRCKQ